MLLFHDKRGTDICYKLRSQESARLSDLLIYESVSQRNTAVWRNTHNTPLYLTVGFPRSVNYWKVVCKQWREGGRPRKEEKALTTTNTKPGPLSAASLFKQEFPMNLSTRRLVQFVPFHLSTFLFKFFLLFFSYICSNGANKTNV